MSEEVVTAKKGRCNGKMEIFARCTGYIRPIESWNKGKREEFKDRRPYDYQKHNIEV
jgi:anaerobic ribonucleoside-triphosphate reductase